MVPYKDLIRNIESEFGTLEKLSNSPSDTAKSYRIKDSKGKIGFISSMSEHFCHSCNRLRITADGNLKVNSKTKGRCVYLGMLKFH